MAETIKIPGVGPVKPVYVYAGVGVVAVVVGVAYFRKASQPAEEAPAPVDEALAGDAGLTDPYSQFSGGDAGATYYPGGSTGITADDLTTALQAWEDAKQTDTKAYATNLDWSYAARGVLTDAGVTDSVAALALANVLAGLSVTTTQQRYFLQAVGLLGAPPDGYPTIRVSDSPAQPTTPAATKLVAPTGLKATGVFREHVTLDWDHVPGAANYIVYRNGQRVQSPAYSLATIWNLKPGTKYTFEVKPVAGKTIGPGTKVTVTTKKK